MDTEIYGQVPIFSREQIRNQYAEAIKSGLDDLESLVDEGIMPFPNDAELVQQKKSVEQGLNHALGQIQKSDATDLPQFFMIDTEKRQQGRGAVWVIADGEVVDFTMSRVLHESNIGA
jgi:hypothetical protein